jgi:hypothetical protein
MTKKDAAVQVWGVATRLRVLLQGDEDVDFEVLYLLDIACELDPGNRRYIDDRVQWSIDDKPGVRVKLRKLIDHPGTPQPEREAALRALDRLKVAT